MARRACKLRYYYTFEPHGGGRVEEKTMTAKEFNKAIRDYRMDNKWFPTATEFRKAACRKRFHEESLGPGIRIGAFIRWGE